MIRCYQKGDAQKVLVQEEQKAEAEKFSAFFDDIKAYSLADENDKILAVFGFVINEFQEGECYALLGKNCGKKMREFIRFGQEKIPLKMREYHLKKAVMTVRKGFVSGERLAHLLGFYVVGLLPKFYLNKDYQLYERK